jgi:siroheme synthase-like protein
LLASGALVTLVAPEVVEAIDRLTHPDGPSARHLEIFRRSYRSGEASGYALVATATGIADIDREVVSDAIAAGVPVSSANQVTPGTVQLPAVHRNGPIVVAVSTGGSSPALARWLRDRIAESIPPDLAIIGELLDEARRSMVAAGRTTDSVDWEAAISDLVAPLVESGRIAEARSALFALCEGAD